ncbi:MAG: hypothetical protein OXG55_04165 [bacterium]|nr:hypothetical protein [bacterium]MCY4102450.1 hypothetical protein [bacterium]
MVGPARRSRGVSEEPDGTLVLTPAVVTAAHEAVLLRRPALVERIESYPANLDQAVRRDR